MRSNLWYFCDKPSFRIPFSKDVPLPVDDSPVEINSSSCPTNSIPSEIPLHSNTVDETETNDLHLREGQSLNVEERNDLMVLLNERKDVFRLGGEPTPFVKHFINTGDHPPVSTAPYGLSPNRKEHLRKEIENLLAHNIIEECESQSAAPVVLVPKSNGTVEVNPVDKDKTPFVCPFGTFRYKRKPFGLRNAPATFQRLMDQFRNGLPNVNILVYLDDIVVLSETFEQHIEDLRMGIEVDQDKTAAIQNISSPRNLKQLQSFLQTCSWYRKFIPDFSDIARPLSNLSKKSTAWKWSEIEQQAFQNLKQCLKNTPILRQVDPKKPFIIRTDASRYTLGAVLLQGESPTDEQPVEYASTLEFCLKKLLDNRARSLGCSLGLKQI
ncbi:retrovirus-related Pol polyprotein from transposon 297 [Trichonephila clavipes]|nr:retrovirus-related Pol polyprotein from transposon 297 [Trichonephila clavipes]